ncbi:SymE family type I addiction module toxin [Thalassomonas actiniarum]|uniref:Type I addiction module toxin, SymE family n=1 Tax=Thalassomonas actiniarum TaxID=485447 RepID=A0AAE9YT76_9GAMM|nr:SymE family type I addiction module toxin [Thalassomonas actiniarum]WDD99062.1 type I addiction module toxin, SymE family [Thalassomonas actiniarum]
MAEYHHTSEPRPAKAKYPTSRQLTVLETACQTSLKPRGIGVNYVPVKLEPCIVLRGKWLKQAGFTIGEKITVTALGRQLVIQPTQVLPDSADKP